MPTHCIQYLHQLKGALICGCKYWTSPTVTVLYDERITIYMRSGYLQAERERTYRMSVWFMTFFGLPSCVCASWYVCRLYFIPRAVKLIQERCHICTDKSTCARFDCFFFWKLAFVKPSPVWVTFCWRRRLLNIMVTTVFLSQFAWSWVVAQKRYNILNCDPRLRTLVLKGQCNFYNLISLRVIQKSWVHIS